MIFCGRGPGKEEGLCFDVGFLNYCNTFTTLIFGEFRGHEKEFVRRSKLHVLKNGGPTDCCTQQFSGGFGT